MHILMWHRIKNYLHRVFLLETQVLGTIFEIEDWEDNESSKSSVLVHEGIVEVNETEGIVLYEGDEVTLIERSFQRPIQIIIIKIIWLTGKRNE